MITVLLYIMACILMLAIDLALIGFIVISVGYIYEDMNNKSNGIFHKISEALGKLI